MPGEKALDAGESEDEDETWANGLPAAGEPERDARYQASGNADPFPFHLIRRREIYTLGRFRVVLAADEGRRTEVPESAWRHGRAKDLLTLLLVQSHQMLTRERAGERLWPHIQETIRRKRLNNAIWNLRQALGDHGHRSTAAVTTTAETIGLRQRTERAAADGSCWVDACAFEALYRQAYAAPSAETQSLLAQQALELYTGDFLIDTAHSEWVQPRQHALRELWIQLLSSTADGWLRAAQPARALAPLLLLVEHAPDHDEAALRAIHLLLHLGRSYEARQLCGRARRRYKTLVGLESFGLLHLEGALRDRRTRNGQTLESVAGEWYAQDVHPLEPVMNYREDGTTGATSGK